MSEESGGPLILMVDDDPEILRSIGILLRGAGHRTDTCSSGPEALAKMETARPDLILLDISMPDMDGYEVCRQIRDREAVADVPVVLSGVDLCIGCADR